MEEIIKQEGLSLWSSTKAFFKHSTTILVARATWLTGLVTAAMGLMNWGPLLSINLDTGLSRNQVFWIGSTVFLQGLVTELARRRTLGVPS